MAPWLIPPALEHLQCTGLALDAFAAPHNAVCPRFWTEIPDAFQQSWSRWLPIWANPPFDQMRRVHDKILTDGAHVVLICPGWRGTLPAFQALATRQYTFPPGRIFLRQGSDLMPPPKWDVHALYINYPGLRPLKHALQSPLSGGTPLPSPRATQLRFQGNLTALSGTATGNHNGSPKRKLEEATTPPSSVSSQTTPPKTGRGACLLSTNIEANPGPVHEPRPARDTNCLDYYLHAFLDRWSLLPFISFEDFFPPDPGPAGGKFHLEFKMWQECTCVCGDTILVSPSHGIRSLVLHIACCVTLHTATGRGAALATCGDVELNPGPQAGPSGPHQHDILGTIVPVICEDWDLGDWEFRGTSVPIIEGPASFVTRLHPQDHEFSGVWGRCPECDLWLWLRGPHTALAHFRKRHPDVELPLAPDPKPEVPINHDKEILRLMGYRFQDGITTCKDKPPPPLTGRGFSPQSTGVEMNPGPASHHRAGRGEDLPTCGDVEENPGPVTSSNMVVDVDAPSPQDPPLLPPPPNMPGPPPDFEVDLAHGGEFPPTNPPQDPAGNHIRITTRPAMGPLTMPPNVTPSDILKLRVSVIRHLPSGLQAEFSTALGGSVGRYAVDPSLANLFAVLALPKLTMRSPVVKGRFSHEHLVSTIRTRLRTFISGDLKTLWEDLAAEQDRLLPQGAQTRARKRARLSQHADAIPAATLRRMRQLVAEGASRKAVDVLMTPGSHDSSDPHVLAKLRSLNPPAQPPDLRSLPENMDPLLGDGEEEGFWNHLVHESIQRFPRGSSGGPSGLRPSHLQDALRRRSGTTSLIQALAMLTSKWIKGDLPQDHSQYWCGANLTPLAKADGGVRPVAVGKHSAA